LGENTKAHFTLGVRPNVQTKSSIPIRAKVEISPKGFTAGQGRNRKKLFNLPQVLINAELYGVVLARRQKKKDNIKIGRAICNAWGGCSSIYNIRTSMF
jgi:hypothetical protein